MVDDCCAAIAIVVKQMYAFLLCYVFYLLYQIIQIMLSMNDQIPTKMHFKV